MAGGIQFPDPSVTGATVPTADATTNTYSAQVVGNKTDAAVTTVGTVATIIAYIKGLLNRTALPSTDSTANAVFTDVLGNKTDAAQTTVGTTRSLMGYVKGLFSFVYPASTTTETAIDAASVTNTSTTIRQLLGSTAGQSRSFAVSGTLQPTNSNADFTVRIYKGAPASEVEICKGSYNMPTACPETVSFFLSFDLVLAAGTRISWNAVAAAGTGGNANLCATISE